MDNMKDWKGIRQKEEEVYSTRGFSLNSQRVLRKFHNEVSTVSEQQNSWPLRRCGFWAYACYMVEHSNI
jgi:hypothetical protein